MALAQPCPKRIQQDIETLSQASTTPPELGTTRFSFTAEDKQARAYIQQQMEDAGLTVRHDGVGNVIGRLEGESSQTVLIGSHFDTVKCAGNFDGMAGVVAGLEIARLIQKANIKPRYSLEIIGLIEEEGSRFRSGLFGSRAILGFAGEKEMREDLIDQDGISYFDAAKRFGLTPDDKSSYLLDPQKIRAFMELHIEQGALLETERVQVGIVQSIAAIQQFSFVATGVADHAGNTPMVFRQDPVQTCFTLLADLNQLAINEENYTVATVGKFEASPGQANIIPGQARFTLDLRSADPIHLNNIMDTLRARIEKIEATSKITFEIEQLLDVAPIHFSQAINNQLHQSAQQRQVSAMNMFSGAGHDAMLFAQAGIETALLFVPSKEGISHNPKEWTEYHQIATGTGVFLDTFLKLD